jgi:hypothetical protein
MDIGFGMIFSVGYGVLIIILLYITNLVVYVPSIPMTQLEAKTLELKSRILDQQNKLLVEETSNDGTRIHAGSSARHW